MLEQRDEAVVNAFRTGYTAEPAGVWTAPGRVNLIGEHTDYNDGFVMPFALDQRVTIAARSRTDEAWSVTSLTNGETAQFDADELTPGMTGWAAYIAGVVWALRESGHRVAGADLALSSDIPMGAGLSSSAALECATLAALAGLNELAIEPLQRAVLARKAENEFVGAPTGLMDQAASTLCVAEHALFFDCRDHTVRQVPLADPELEILVLDTNTPHAHVDGEYAARRASCDEAARLLGVPALRDVSDLESALAGLDDELLRRRVRHVITENARVLDAVKVLDHGRLSDLAPLLDASHASMRDDFEITVPTVDLAVESAREAGALGARMTGGGFGGCIIALVPAGKSAEIADQIGDRFAAAGFDAPSHFVGRPSAGARRIV